jgi:hypothetical protein
MRSVSGATRHLVETYQRRIAPAKPVPTRTIRGARVGFTTDFKT